MSGSRATTVRSGTNPMSRSANRARIACEVSGDGGSGVPNGMTSWMVTASRRPRSRRYSSRRIAASLGAGGHLNGVPQMPTIAWPYVKPGQDAADGLRTRDRVELVAGLRQARRRRDVVVRAERNDQDVGLVCPRRSRRAGLGSIAVIVSWRNRTCGVARSRYGRRTAAGVRVPNITSSFEKPKTKASARSISVTSTRSPSASDSRVDSSSPPNPAPRMSTEVVTASG